MEPYPNSDKEKYPYIHERVVVVSFSTEPSAKTYQYKLPEHMYTPECGELLVVPVRSNGYDILIKVVVCVAYFPKMRSKFRNLSDVIFYSKQGGNLFCLPRPAPEPNTSTYHYPYYSRKRGSS